MVRPSKEINSLAFSWGLDDQETKKDSGKTGFSWDLMVLFRMRSKGSRFTLGVWGLKVCSLDVAFTVATVRNRPQPSATVRNRPRDCYMAVPMVSSAGGVLFVGVKRLVASFRVAAMALRDIQTYFVTCRKSFRVAGAILLRRFQMCCIFVAGAALWTCPSWFFVAGAAL